MKNIKIIIEFDGTNYCGWQRQQNAPTVCGTLEERISECLGEKIDLTGCSRTDTGVHAVSYCANFYTNTDIPADRLYLALRRDMPSDILLKSSEEVPEDFHACFSARSKTYRYYFTWGDGDHPLLSNRVWQLYARPDPDRMKRAASYFIGTHDFEAFRNADPASKKKTTERIIYSSDVNMLTLNGKEFFVYEVCGNGFLYNMVRIMAGTIAECGLGKKDPEDIPGIIESRERKKAGVTAPPCGLYLYKVEY